METTAEATPTGTDSVADTRNDARNYTLRAAHLYAEHGWPVLPGSAWNGRRYQVPGTRDRITDGVRTTVPRNYATTDPDIISGWWHPGGQLFPTVLLRSGPAFDLLSVDRTIATAALTNPRFRNNVGPVVFRPDQGRACFMVTPALKRPEKFSGERGDIVLMDIGSWVLVPPSRLQPGLNVSWWVAPEAVNWTVANFDIVVDVLETLATDRTPLVTAD